MKATELEADQHVSLSVGQTSNQLDIYAIGTLQQQYSWLQQKVHKIMKVQDKYYRETVLLEKPY